MDFKTLAYEQKEHYGLLTINRPDVFNAINDELLVEVEEFCNKIVAQDIRCLILTGAGEKAFVAGADLKEMQQRDPASAYEFSANGQRVFDMLADLPFATIAAVNGFALGGGLELALTCDFIVASEKAKFGLPEVTLGLIPGYGGTQRLARAVGINNARMMTFTGDMITADQALTYGLASFVCSPEELLPTAEKLAITIASRGPKAVQLAKTAVNQGTQLPLSEGQPIEAQQFAAALQGDESTEGVAAFVEKRSPNF